MIDLSNVTAIALGSDDVLQIQDAIGTVLWQKIINYNVTISAGNNGSVSVNGVSGNYSQSVQQGTVLTIEGTGNTGYDFDEWSDGNTDNPRTITVNSDITLTAAFEEVVVLPDYFYVEDVSGSDNTLSITKNNASAPTIEVFKSTDRINWTSMGSTSNTNGITATIPANSKLYLKATSNTWANGDTKYNHITATGNNNVGGNAMSLLYGDNFENQTTFPTGSTWCLSGILRSNTTLVSASSLKLPATTLAGSCYKAMFQGCTSLTAVPTLPATTLAGSCYKAMFQGCTSLVTVPADLLPVTTLTDSCYQDMFSGCTSLTNTPTLNATTLTNNCYRGMFWTCTSLTTAPVLPATTLATNCYYSMFQYCTGLTTAPVLPATTLVGYCYRTMFEYCSNLNNVTVYADDISAENCTYKWLHNVSGTGVFYNLGSATYTTGENGIPSGWTEHTTL